GVDGGVAGIAGEAGFGGAAGRTLGAGDEDFTGVALHPRLDAHTQARFVLAEQRGQTAGNVTARLTGTLPVGDEFAGTRTLLGNLETVVGEELANQRPDFRRAALGDQPAVVAAPLQAELADVGLDRHRVRARGLELAGARRHVRNRLGDRQD